MNAVVIAVFWFFFKVMVFVLINALVGIGTGWLGPLPQLPAAPTGHTCGATPAAQPFLIDMVFASH